MPDAAVVILAALAFAFSLALCVVYTTSRAWVRHPKKHGLLYLPLAILILRSIQERIFFVQRLDGTDLLNEGLSAGNIFSAALTGAGIFLLLRCILTGQITRAHIFQHQHAPFLLLSSIYATTCLWSAMPIFSLYRATELVTFGLLAIGIFENLRDISSFVRVFHLFNLTWILTSIPLMLDSFAQGIFFSAVKDNLYPTVAAFPIVFFLAGRTRGALFIFVTGIAAFFLAGSAAAVGALLPFAGTALAFSKNPIVRVLGILIALFFVAGDVIFLISPELFPGIIEATSILLQKPADELARATGRYAIWELMWRASSDALFGLGFAMDRFVVVLLGAGVVSEIFDVGTTNIASAHNAVISAWVSAGALGAATVVILFLHGIIACFRADGRLRSPLLGYALFVIINSMTTPGVGGPYSVMYLGWIAAMSMSALQLPERVGPQRKKQLVRLSYSPRLQS